MGKGFKLKPRNNFKKKKNVIIEEKPLSSPYVKEKSKIIYPVYFDFNNYDDPPKIHFNMPLTTIWEPCIF